MPQPLSEATRSAIRFSPASGEPRFFILDVDMSEMAFVGEIARVPDNVTMFGCIMIFGARTPPGDRRTGLHKAVSVRDCLGLWLMPRSGLMIRS